MIFKKYKSIRLPNDEYQVILFADKEIYGNIIGVNKGIAFEFTHKNYITVWRKILKKHKKSKKYESTNNC